MMHGNRMRNICLLLLALYATSCSATPTSAPRPMSEEDYPWRLHEPAEFGADFVWRQKVTASFGPRKMAFQAVVQKKGNVMTLIGLGPAGSKAFVLTQTGKELDFRSSMPRSLPFPPRFILIDIQRAWLPLGEASAPGDGERVLPLSDEKGLEVRAQGRRVRRTFSRSSGQPAGEIRVRYLPPVQADRPGVVELHNGWFGYALTIETLEAQAL